MPLAFRAAMLYMMLFGLPLPMIQSIFVIMMIATITTATAATLPSLITGSLNTVMAQGQNMTADIGGGFVPGNATSGNATSGNTMSGNMTDTKGTLVNETGFIN
jgi:hypothetical protein